MFITKYEQKGNLRPTRFQMCITKYEQNETYDPLDFNGLLLNTSKMKLKA